MASLEDRRIFIGGLVKGVTESELQEKFSRFGQVSQVEIKTRFNDPDSKTFAYLNLAAEENAFKKCFSTYNNTKWKGGQLKLQFAKESFLSKLKQEQEEVKRLSAEKQNSEEDALPKRPVLRVPQKAVPGTPLDENGTWVMGKYSRVLPVLKVHKPSSRKIVILDPGKMTHTLKKLKTDDLDDRNRGELTWQMEAKDKDVVKRIQGQFPEWKAPNQQTEESFASRLQALAALDAPVSDTEMEIVPVSKPASNRRKRTVSGSDSDSAGSADTDEIFSMMSHDKTAAGRSTGNKKDIVKTSVKDRTTMPSAALEKSKAKRTKEINLKPEPPGRSSPKGSMNTPQASRTPMFKGLSMALSDSDSESHLSSPAPGDTPKLSMQQHGKETPSASDSSLKKKVKKQQKPVSKADGEAMPISTPAFKRADGDESGSDSDVAGFSYVGAISSKASGGKASAGMNLSNKKEKMKNSGKDGPTMTTPVEKSMAKRTDECNSESRMRSTPNGSMNRQQTSRTPGFKGLSMVLSDSDSEDDLQSPALVSTPQLSLKQQCGKEMQYSGNASPPPKKKVKKEQKQSVECSPAVSGTSTDSSTVTRNSEQATEGKKRRRSNTEGHKVAGDVVKIDQTMSNSMINNDSKISTTSSPQKLKKSSALEQRAVSFIPSQGHCVKDISHGGKGEDSNKLERGFGNQVSHATLPLPFSRPPLVESDDSDLDDNDFEAVGRKLAARAKQRQGRPAKLPGVKPKRTESDSEAFNSTSGADKGKKSLDSSSKGKHIIFEREEDESVKEKPALFSDGSDSEGEVDFSVRPQFEGSKGQKLLELQMRFQDERFKLDSQFLSDDDEMEEVEKENERGSDEEILQEKRKSQEILEKVLGYKPRSRTRVVYQDMSQRRYDPSRMVQPDKKTMSKKQGSQSHRTQSKHKSESDSAGEDDDGDSEAASTDGGDKGGAGSNKSRDLDLDSGSSADKDDNGTDSDSKPVAAAADSDEGNSDKSDDSDSDSDSKAVAADGSDSDENGVTKLGVNSDSDSSEHDTGKAGVETKTEEHPSALSAQVKPAGLFVGGSAFSFFGTPTESSTQKTEQSTRVAEDDEDMADDDGHEEEEKSEEDKGERSSHADLRSRAAVSPSKPAQLPSFMVAQDDPRITAAVKYFKRPHEEEFAELLEGWSETRWNLMQLVRDRHKKACRKAKRMKMDHVGQQKPFRHSQKNKKRR